MDTFKVLSIDFDYFQNITYDYLQYYPDGIDLPTDISNLVWCMRYVENYQKLHKIEINKSLLYQVINLLRNQSHDIPVMIVNTHKWAYDFIKEHNNGKSIELVNMDLHHDIFNDSDSLDCGNWISHVASDFSLKSFTWIGRKVSEKMYELTDEDKQKLHFTLGMQDIIEEKFDAIFICRSDNWMPPHLDDYFEKVLTLCIEMFYDLELASAYPVYSCHSKGFNLGGVSWLNIVFTLLNFRGYDII